MSLLFMDGFDNYNAPAIGALGKWQSYIQVGTSALSINAGTGRFGTNSLKAICVNGGAATYMQSVRAGSLSSIILGVAINVLTFEPSNETAFLAFLDVNAAQVTVSFLPNGQIRFRGGNAGGTILATSTASVITATGTFFYLEFQITFNSASGAIVLHSNGVNVPLSASSGLNTAPSGNNSFNTHQLGCPNSGGQNTTSIYLFDDHYLVSTSGGSNTTFLGDVRVVTLFPNAPGTTTQFTPNGAAADWQCVNEASEDGDTTYASDATVGQKDIYNHGATPTNTGQIFGVQLDSVARKDDAAGRSIANTVLSGPTSQDGATQALSQTYAWYLDIMENDPNTSTPWTKTTVDAAQFGAKVAA